MCQLQFYATYSSLGPNMASRIYFFRYLTTNFQMNCLRTFELVIDDFTADSGMNFLVFNLTNFIKRFMTHSLANSA